MAISSLLPFSSFLLHEWQSLYDILYKLFTVFTRDRNDGVFEVLDYDSTLELRDERGELATIYRRQKVKFLQNHVVAFQDFVWGGQGEQLAEYIISPGRVAGIYPESNRWNILIALDEVKSKGDVVEFHIQRTIRNGFTQNIEWRQTEIWKRTRRARLAIVFPLARLCKRAILTERGAHRSTPLGPQHFTRLPDGRQILAWEKKRPRRAEVYTIEWEW